MTVSEYLSVIFCWAVGGICFLHKKEWYICFEVTSKIGREPQFSLIYVRVKAMTIYKLGVESGIRTTRYHPKVTLAGIMESKFQMPTTMKHSKTSAAMRTEAETSRAKRI